jgi:hypothetical protein
MAFLGVIPMRSTPAFILGALNVEGSLASPRGNDTLGRGNSR